MEQKRRTVKSAERRKAANAPIIVLSLHDKNFSRREVKKSTTGRRMRTHSNDSQ
jgi:hypothetical protein